MKKIMIVDDEMISLMMTEHILSTEYNTICASSGQEAISLYEQERPDMVLSDLRMPGMSGYELQQRLQKMFSETIPFMFMTADSDDETESKGFENGALDFIRKPFRADVLLRRVGNILQTVEQIQGLKKAAVTDPMTGLLNKASAQEEIGVLCRSASGVLMMIDLDSFKLVNDIYGHAMGDKVLIRFAEIIRSAVRSTDLVGRMGGDEFIAFCQNIPDESVIAKKSEYINSRLVESAKEFMGEDMNIPLGASLGCVMAPEEGDNFHDLYKKADKALYNVKQHGKHGYAFYKDDSGSEGIAGERVTDLANTFMILKERNPAKGAFVLSYEHFRSVFRFLYRITGNYKKEIWMAMFTLIEKDGADIEMSQAEASDAFFSILCNSLRQSDIVTEQGKNQFLAVLYELSRANMDQVMIRVMDNWKEDPASHSYSIVYEMDIMK
ncbi:MAG: diguanylate cyclase [Lachnospiraceae bacterium]|nr:diguanylate cyclase [Lachnospiraceae bacterium]